MDNQNPKPELRHPAGKQLAEYTTDKVSLIMLDNCQELTDQKMAQYMEII